MATLAVPEMSFPTPWLGFRERADGKTAAASSSTSGFFACETCIKDMHLRRCLVRYAADEGRTGQEGGWCR